MFVLLLSLVMFVGGLVLGFVDFHLDLTCIYYWGWVRWWCYQQNWDIPVHLVIPVNPLKPKSLSFLALGLKKLEWAGSRFALFIWPEFDYANAMNAILAKDRLVWNQFKVHHCLEPENRSSTMKKDLLLTKLSPNCHWCLQHSSRLAEKPIGV